MNAALVSAYRHWRQPAQQAALRAVRLMPGFGAVHAIQQARHDLHYGIDRS